MAYVVMAYVATCRQSSAKSSASPAWGAPSCRADAETLRQCRLLVPRMCRDLAGTFKKIEKSAVIEECLLTVPWHTAMLLRMPDAHNTSTDLFLATFRGMPTANADGYVDSEGSVGECLGCDAPFGDHSDRQRALGGSPSARSGMPKKKTALAATIGTRRRCSSGPSRCSARTPVRTPSGSRAGRRSIYIVSWSIYSIMVYI